MYRIQTEAKAGTIQDINESREFLFCFIHMWQDHIFVH